MLMTSRRRAQAPWPHSALRQSLPAGKDCRQSARRQTREHSHARLHRSSPPRRRPHSSGRRAAGSGGPMRRRSARQLLSSAGSCRRTALSRSDQATPPPECCRHAVVHARVWCADRLGAGALSERLRRPAVAQSELCRAVGPGEAGARSPPGSRNNREGTVDRKRALSGRGACLPFGNIAKIRPLLDLGLLGMLIWCGLCSRHSSDRATWYVHRTGRGTKVAFISE